MNLAADLDADGHLDLLGYESISGPTAILRGDGKGAFLPSTQFQLGDRVKDVAAIDFNNDNLIDLAVIRDFIPTVQIYINNGNGGFNQPVQIGLPTIANNSTKLSGLIKGDFNGDKKMDLLLSHTDSGDIAIIPNGNTSGYNVGVRQSIILGAADFNNDGLSDLLAAPMSGPGTKLNLFLADGQGGFKPARSFSFIGQITSSAVFEDLNGDGNVDVAFGAASHASLPAGGATGSVVTIYFGDGQGGLGAQTNTIINNLASNQVTKIKSADFNNDAKPDVFFASRGTLYILQNGWQNDGSGGFLTPLTIAIGTAVVGGIDAGDFDEDGRIDLLTPSNTPSSIDILLNRCGAAGFAISGRVRDANTTRGLGGVTVALNGSQVAKAQTDIGGNFNFPGLPQGGTYTVAVDAPGYLFNPASVTKANLAASEVVNFNGNKQAANVSAASYTGRQLAPGSIVAAFGASLARDTVTVKTLPLPIYLIDTRVEVGKIGPGYRSAPLFFVSPTQVNYLIPPDTPIGPAQIKITQYPYSTEYSISVQDVEIVPVAPGLFTANSDGRGVVAAVILRVKIDGTQVYEPAAVFDQAQKQFIASPIDLGPEGEQVFLIMFGTGFRNRSALSNTNVTVGGVNSQVLYAGPQGDLVGLDQLNARLPRSLAGRGDVDIVMTVDGNLANTVSINIK